MCNANSKRRHGFTLIELAVVIAVMGILAALLLMGVQAARETSRRITCVSNLKQIGLALSNYEATHGVYPKGANGPIFSAHTMLLPHLEQTALYHAFNFNVFDTYNLNSTYKANFTARHSRIVGFTCPSDPYAQIDPITNYAWNGGFGIQWEKSVGTFGTGRTKIGMISAADIRDGLSQTAAMSEWKLGDTNSTDDTTVVFRVRLPFQASHEEFIHKCRIANRQTTEFGSWSKSAFWSFVHYGDTLLNFNTPPGSLTCYRHFYGDSEANWPAVSYHERTVNVLFHDGHVANFRDAIPLNLWHSLSTRASGDVFE